MILNLAACTVSSGHLFIRNSTLGRCLHGVQSTGDQSTNVSIEYVRLHELGSYYASLGSVLQNIEVSRSLNVEAGHISIGNCMFSFVSPTGVLRLYSYMLGAIVDSDFLLLDAPGIDYEGYHYFVDYSHLKSLVNETFGADVAKNVTLRFIEQGLIFHEHSDSECACILEQIVHFPVWCDFTVDLYFTP